LGMSRLRRDEKKIKTAYSVFCAHLKRTEQLKCRQYC